ncbi:hypothetical protein BAE44_0003699 [Dichanthelium oligosanthes]|uniref:Uncharacterized protein n=1 Tax=Dichanthelium oligosanthes TaxID=888268 RepID=A0A1E5WD20_9POAL|nr:hypothetical protein BAE44_0003699 [Dichanthelium oligosanthes]
MREKIITSPGTGSTSISTGFYSARSPRA